MDRMLGQRSPQMSSLSRFAADFACFNRAARNSAPPLQKQHFPLLQDFLRFVGRQNLLDTHMIDEVFTL
jgi:hypothetical protein